MRIISKTGEWDFQYEESMVWREGTVIKCNPSREPNPGYIIARYSTSEKAEKAIQLLHEAYSGMPIICDISESEYKEKKLKELLETTNITMVPNEISKIEYVSRMVFQFPNEEDL